MKRPSLRFNLKTLVAVVAVAGWIAFNCRMLHDLMMRGVEAGDGGRIIFFFILAWVIATPVGFAVFAVFWRRAPKARLSVMRGFIAGACAGYCAWGLATMIIFLGERPDGQAWIGAIVLGAVGATINCLPGAFVGLANGRLKRNRGTDAADEPPPAEWSLDPDAVD
jgi:hypothetical protein